MGARKVRGPDGNDYWENKAGVVEGHVRPGKPKPREDKKEYEERDKVEKLVEAWGWPVDSTNIERPDGGATYEFDCTNGVTGERVAVEVKGIPLPDHAMKDSAAKRNTDFSVAEFVLIPGALVKRANHQLDRAPRGVRRCLLLAWAFEPMDDDDPWWEWLIAALIRVDFHSYANVDEVWLTTSHMTRFFRWNSADGLLSSPRERAIRVRCVVCGKTFEFEVPVPSQLPWHKRRDDETMNCIGVLWEPA